MRLVPLRACLATDFLATYNASKAYVSTYLQGYHQRANHSNANITVTDLQPGFVESEMTDGKPGMFWVASTQKAARQMADAIGKNAATHTSPKGGGWWHGP